LEMNTFDFFGIDKPGVQSPALNTFDFFGIDKEQRIV